jgi:hypothetical protein
MCVLVCDFGTGTTGPGPVGVIAAPCLAKESASLFPEWPAWALIQASLMGYLETSDSLSRARVVARTTLEVIMGLLRAWMADWELLKMVIGPDWANRCRALAARSMAVSSAW